MSADNAAAADESGLHALFALFVEEGDVLDELDADADDEPMDEEAPAKLAEDGVGAELICGAGGKNLGKNG